MNRERLTSSRRAPRQCDGCTHLSGSRGDSPHRRTLALRESLACCDSGGCYTPPCSEPPSASSPPWLGGIPEPAALWLSSGMRCFPFPGFEDLTARIPAFPN
ncbi:hypothetical protein NDU88_006201 [Pleurodeles waltl]|uniref:Uncharacterized protein n=1 Tax=Pleurodeles waltl TaxID=8319 RepID=A0AAV7LRS6_PLEWA|nr:hypothetical protein NDU88_006201 [Pleurodeles waltl]